MYYYHVKKDLSPEDRKQLARLHVQEDFYRECITAVAKEWATAYVSGDMARVAKAEEAGQRIEDLIEKVDVAMKVHQELVCDSAV